LGETYVLDSYALLALLGGEPGRSEVAQILRQTQEGEVRSLMTWVNLGEVACIVERRWGQQRLFQVLGTLESTALELVPAARSLALAAAHIKAGYPLAYADAFAAALTIETSATLVTGDPEFQLLEAVLHIQWLPRRS
jgi:predicted nucleic acid-binding protein